MILPPASSRPYITVTPLLSANGLGFLLRSTRSGLSPPSYYHRRAHKEGIRTMPLFPASINGVKAPTFFTKAFNTVREGNTKYEDYHPHTLRHSFAVHMLQKDINNILRVQANLGHKSLATTEIYLRNAKLYGVKNAMSPAQLAKELCVAFSARTGL